jgi:hypothetical protein
VLDLERPGIEVHLDLHLAPEPGRYSPRVPADAASAIFELILVDYLSCLVYHRERRGGQPDAISADARQVSLARLPFEEQSDGNLLGARALYFRPDQQRGPRLGLLFPQAGEGLRCRRFHDPDAPVFIGRPQGLQTQLLLYRVAPRGQPGDRTHGQQDRHDYRKQDEGNPGLLRLYQRAGGKTGQNDTRQVLHRSFFFRGPFWQ